MRKYCGCGWQTGEVTFDEANRAYAEHEPARPGTPQQASGSWVLSGIPTQTRLDQSDATSPPHYQANGVEAIDVIEAFELGFRLANVVKYVLRAGRKGDALVDLRKGLWYLEREIAAREKEAK